MALQESISLAFLLYTIGMSWTLVGSITFEVNTRSGELVQFVLLWPMVWIFLILFGFFVAWDRFIETSMDLGEGLQIKFKRNK